MLCGFRRLFTLALMLASGTAVAAELPETRDLERAGLVNAWWGRAVVDQSQDVVEYLVPDEQILLAQSRQGLLTAFRTDTGRVQWSVLLGGPGIRAFPAVMNEQVVIVSAGLNLYALDKATGETRWQLRLPNHPSCTPEVDEAQLYVGTTDGSVYAYDLNTIRGLFGERKLPAYTHIAQVWRYKTPLDVVSIVSNGDSVNFVSRIGSLYGVDAKRRRLRFQIETNDRVDAQLGRGPDAIYLASRDARMLSVSLTNGDIRWAFTSGTPIIHRPRVIGGQVFVAPSRMGMYCLDSATGKELWGGPSVSATEFLAAGEQRLYASNELGNLIVLDRASGKVVDQISLRKFSVRAANELTDRIYVSTTDGFVACFREQGQTVPLFHRNPERRPILPEFAPEEGATEAAN